MNLVDIAPDTSEPENFVCSDIRLEWDWIKPQIETILLEQSHLTYRPEDVYANCVNGSAILLTIEKTKFVVVETLTDNFTHKKTLNIWLAWVSPEHKSQTNTALHLPFFENMARDFGCSYLECSTDKPRLGRLYTSIGWKLKTQVYIKDLGETS